jgi:hypothetical protein
LSGPLNLILNYGKQTVFDTGIKTLGYPGTWATHEHETKKIKQEIKL